MIGARTGLTPRTGRRVGLINRRSRDWRRHAFWVGLVLVPFFLRGTSLPVPISQTYLFYACYVSVTVVSALLMLTGALHLRLGVALMVLTTVPSLVQEGIGQESILRWVAWVVVVAAVGPLVVSPEAGRYRRQLWDAVRWMSLGVCCASFVVWAGDLGLSLSGRGVFYGVMSHSMVLAPIAGLTAIDCLYRYMRGRERVWLVMMALATIILLLCGSRAASFAWLIGSLWMVLNARGSIRRYGVVAVAGVLVTLAVLDSNAFSEQPDTATGERSDAAFTGVLRKKSLSDTRTWLWEARLREFEESPVAGVGFARTHYGRTSDEGDYIEPGSSYLAILSMTGLAGGMGWLVLFGGGLERLTCEARPSCPRSTGCSSRPWRHSLEST